jgi:hypothetical protein
VAKVTKKDRQKTKERTGSSKFPMENASQVRSAIKLRHHGKGVSASTVLSRASRAVSRLKRQGKISESTAEALRKKIQEARKRDQKKGK